MASEKSVMAVIRASRPSFRNSSDKLAFVVHASFLASGYVLTATGPPAYSDTAFTSPSTDDVGIDRWNELEDDYAFVYANPEKGSKKVLVKCLVMNDKLLVDALAEGGSEPVHLEINVGDYVEENQGTNYSAHYKNLEKLVMNLDSEILSKLEGTSSTGTSSNKPSGSETREGSRHINEPGVGIAEPRGRQPYPMGPLYPPVNPIGGSDLFPGPGAGVYPTWGDPSGGGGMLLGPNDPRWFGGSGGGMGFPGAPPGVPPGARFDPFGPPGVPGFEPDRFVRHPRRPGNGAHPDLQQFGNGSDFI